MNTLSITVKIHYCHLTMKFPRVGKVHNIYIGIGSIIWFSDDILKKLTLCMGNIEKQNRAMLSRVESLESNQYSQGYMMSPPWLMGQQHYMVPPANNLSQSFGGNSLSSLLQVSSPSHSQFSSPLSTSQVISQLLPPLQIKPPL